MSRGDLLLQWASCFHEIRIARVRAAAQRLCAPPTKLPQDHKLRDKYIREGHRLARTLIRLGHLEQLNSERVRTVPPTIVLREAGYHFSVGARWVGLWENLKKANGIERIEPIPQAGGAPSLWHLQGSLDAVSAAAQRLKIFVTREQGGHLLGALPALVDVLKHAPTENVPDRSERWNPDAQFPRQRWQRVQSDQYTPGLYRTIRKPYQWYLNRSGIEGTLRLDTPERLFAAAWSIAGRKSPVTFSPQKLQLQIPAIGFALPLLVERGLILASGRLPERNDRHWQYAQIDRERAQDVARVLGTTLEEIE